VQDLVSRDALQYIFQPSYQSAMFGVEAFLGVLLPFVMLLFPKVRASKKGLFYAAVFTLLGFVAYRMNTAITSMEQWPTRTYIPSWQELFITLGLAAFGFVAFTYIAKNFKVFGEKSHHEEGGLEIEPYHEPELRAVVTK
jgi:Ni/Fe-hydrogenase subunit HybB-like protein